MRRMKTRLQTDNQSPIFSLEEQNEIPIVARKFKSAFKKFLAYHLGRIIFLIFSWPSI